MLEEQVGLGRCHLPGENRTTAQDLTWCGPVAAGRFGVSGLRRLVQAEISEEALGVQAELGWVLHPDRRPLVRH